ncbi:MAG: RNA 2',3'-cyclic phosphodiesterase [Povalibacter sp.]
MSSVTDAQHRVFFALWPSDSLREQIAEQTRDLVGATNGRVIPPRNLHVTLLFLGVIPFASVIELAQSAAEIRTSAFTIEFDQSEVWARSKVLVLSATRKPVELESLVDGLQISSLRIKATLESEEYRPHVTLARNVKPSREPWRQVPSIQWVAKDFVLVDSSSSANGSIYTVLHRWPLLETP